MKHYNIAFNVPAQLNVPNALQIIFYKGLTAKLVAMKVKKIYLY